MLHRVMRSTLFLWIAIISIAIFASSETLAQVEVGSVLPLGIEPGKTTKVVLSGKGLQSPLRIASTSDATFHVVSSEATTAVVEVTLPAGTSPGTFGFWVASSEGVSEPLSMLVDDLPSIVDNANNHRMDQAQEVPTLSAVDGTSDGPLSDFYRFHATQKQRLSFEVHSQRMGSTMDSVLKLWDPRGKLLLQADDEANGPDSRFTFEFPEEGDYLLEIRESRFVAGGRYRLRIGDFPIVHSAFPLAVRPGSQATCAFLGQDASLIEPVQVSIPSNPKWETWNVAAKISGGKSSSWGRVGIRNVEQHVAPEKPDPQPVVRSIPFGLSGLLKTPESPTQTWIKGVQGEAIRVTSMTRSLGLPTMLQMRLYNAAGAKVAETAVGETDEWSMDFTFPDSGDYRIDVNDLLHRTGPAFAYYFEVRPIPKFSVALKPDAKTKERFPIELGPGAAAIDLQIARSGYDGPIDIGVVSAVEGIEVLNPRIEAKAAAKQIYLRATEKWTADSLAAIKLIASSAEVPEQKGVVGTAALRRIKAPHVPFPDAWRDGLMLVSGVTPTPAYYQLEAPSIVLARPQTSHAASLTLKRTLEAFKGGVTILPFQQLPEWNVAAKVEKDLYSLTWTRTNPGLEPASLPLLVYSEHGDRGRLQLQQFPVQWIDPLKVTLQSTQVGVAGGTQRIEAQLEWSPQATPQPVQLAWQNLPAGFSAAPVDVAADQRRVSLELQIAPDVAATQVGLQLQAKSQFGGQPFQVTSEILPVTLATPPTQLEVYPATIALDNMKDFRHVIVTGFDAGGSPRDWTRECRMVSSNPAIVRIAEGRAFPVADGAAEVIVELGTLRKAIPVTVANAQVPRRTQFENDVLVALSKQSCNSGACHGSPSGKGGFRLSLRAFDPALDELTLIREEFGRRTNPMEPEKSLLLLKPMMKLVHGGGMQLHKGDPAYEILRSWIAEGAKMDPPNTARCVKLELYPATRRVLNRATAPKQQMAAIAHFADGTTRDVTHQVAYESSNTSVAEVNAKGLVSSHRRGEAAILVRYLEHIESVPMMFVEDVEGFVWQSPPANNFIDELIDAKLKQLQYLPSPIANDSEFLRRVYLDVIGILPTVDETKEFLANGDPNKRTRLIDSLLERPEHAPFWALKWGDLLRMTGKNIGDEGVYKYHRWVEQAIRENMPYDEFTRVLLTSSGSTLSNPAANFYRAANDTNDCVETISQVFLGARLQCAKCHNHPFERWTQDNYYGLGAFFQRVQRKKTQRPGELFVWTSNTGEVTQPRTGKVMKPWLPQVGSIEPTGEEDRRRAFADWLVKPENPYFARIEANRIWSQLFSRGIVDPIDDFRDSNPPSNAPLLDALAKDFVDHRFDRRHLLRRILNSRTYQTSFQTNPFNREDTKYFSHQEPRLLTAEQLLDAVNHTTAVQQTFGPLPPGTRATQLPAPDLVKVDFLKVFGQPERSTVCACERSEDSNLAMAIELFNGPVIYERLRDPKNRFRVALQGGQSFEDVLRDLYLAAICRLPSESEIATALEHKKTRPDEMSAMEDICWALLNTDEFLFQH